MAEYSGTPIRAAVIGVGSIGRHHARVYTELHGVELCAVADTDPTNAHDIAQRFKVPAYADFREMIDKQRPECVSIAVPTALHHQVAREVLLSGVHALIEKPMTITLSEARDLIRLAAERDLRLAVGHVERFNPAVRELKHRLDKGELGQVFHMHARRLSPFPRHVRDVGVVMDLATHELDIMRYLLGADVAYLYADMGRRVHETHEDLLSCTLRFSTGAIGVLDINWLTPTKVRELRVTGSRGMFLIDYLMQDLHFFDSVCQPSQWESIALLKGMDEGSVLKIQVSRAEPLRLELADFVRAVAARDRPTVDGSDGLRALSLAQAVLLSGVERRVVVPSEG